MRNTRKILLLPVLAVASAAIVLFASLGLSAANVPMPSTTDTVAADAGTALTIKSDWNETAGSNNKKGTAGGANGGLGCAIKR